MTANDPKRTFASAMTRESAIRTRALLALALVLTGCNPPLVYNPQQPIAPNINDRSAPDLELRVYYDATRFDSVVKPTEAFFFAPYRCIYVSNPFRVVVAGTDLDGGISYLNIGSPDLVPTAGAIIATPLPDVPTQVDDQSERREIAERARGRAGAEDLVVLLEQPRRRAARDLVPVRANRLEARVGSAHQDAPRRDARSASRPFK